MELVAEADPLPPDSVDSARLERAIELLETDDSLD